NCHIAPPQPINPILHGTTACSENDRPAYSLSRVPSFCTGYQMRLENRHRILGPKWHESCAIPNASLLGLRCLSTTPDTTPRGIEARARMAACRSRIGKLWGS